MPREFTIAIFNLEGVTSVSILKLLVSEMTHLEPQFVLFTNVYMEPYFPTALTKMLKEKGYLSDHSLPVGKGHQMLSTREILFRNKDIIPMDPAKDEQFDGINYGYRTFRYALSDVKEPGSGEFVKIRTFTMPRDQTAYNRNSRIKAMCVGELNFRTVDLLTSDFLIREHELYDPPDDWRDVFDFGGSMKENENYDFDRRDRVWFRHTSAKVVKMTSSKIDDPNGRLVGQKTITFVTLTNESW